MLTLRLLDDPRDGRWNRFAEGWPGCTIFHLSGWLGVFRDCFQVEPFFLQALESDDRLAGILPLYAGHSLFLGRYLSSTGGAALGDGPGVIRALHQRALVLRDEQHLAYLCLRGEQIAGSQPHRLLPTVNTVVDLTPGPAAIWEGLGSNLRRKVRKAMKNGFRVEEDPAALEDFYGVYARNVRHLGTPVFGRKMFGSMARHFPGRLKLLVVRREGEVVGGQLSLRARGAWTSLFLAVDRRLLGLYPTYLLYWEAIRRAATEGAASLDLGRSLPGGGTHRFKRQWAQRDVAHDFAFYYAVWPRGRRPEQMAALSTSPLRRLWPHLPQGLANLVGPLIRRSLPLA